MRDIPLATCERLSGANIWLVVLARARLVAYRTPAPRCGWGAPSSYTHACASCARAGLPAFAVKQINANHSIQVSRSVHRRATQKLPLPSCRLSGRLGRICIPPAGQPAVSSSYPLDCGSEECRLPNSLPVTLATNLPYPSMRRLCHVN